HHRRRRRLRSFPTRRSSDLTVYYAVGVYAEGANGIVAFDAPWKNVCATFYHELCEARTDPDIEDAIRAGNTPRANDFVGWYSPRSEEHTSELQSLRHLVCRL